MKELVLATRNQGKVRELRELLAGIDVHLTSLADYPQIPEIDEDGDTFAANARKKALVTARLTGHLALADDSGLMVDALNGQPGVYSARFAGQNASDAANNRKLLQLLADVPWQKRTARFVSAIAIAHPDGRLHTVEGICEGYILTEYRGNNGFGYDPLFFVSELGQTYAEMSEADKNRISHRGRALRQAVDYLMRVLQNGS